MQQDELDAELVKSARQLLDVELSKCNEYVMPYSKEPEIIKLAEKWFAFNLTASGAISKQKIHQLVTSYKLSCNINDFTDDKYICVFIDRNAPVQEYVKPSSKVFVIKQQGFQTHIML